MSSSNGHDKSHVSMEQRQCLACGEVYDTGSLLLDKRMRSILDRHTVTGWGLCPEHTKEGFVTLVECANKVRGTHISNENVAGLTRTGRIAMVRSEAWTRVSSVPLPPNGVAFIECGVIEKLSAMQEGDSNEE